MFLPQVGPTDHLRQVTPHIAWEVKLCFSSHDRVFVGWFDDSSLPKVRMFVEVVSLVNQAFHGPILWWWLSYVLINFSLCCMVSLLKFSSGQVLLHRLGVKHAMSMFLQHQANIFPWGHANLTRGEWYIHPWGHVDLARKDFPRCWHFLLRKGTIYFL